ncbi:MAG: hypothetical protein IIW94_00250 [Clostridia bacterium]|nr:hypothetical protein [Clostridia bacterium]
MLKRIIAIVLALLLVFSFAACKKDKTDGTSSVITDSNPTQDFDNDEWDEGEDLTDEEKEELEELWNDIVNNGGAEIVGGDTSSTGSDTQSSQVDSSADTGSTDSSNAEHGNSSEASSELSGEVVSGDVPGIW